MVERVSWAVGSDTERILTGEDARIAWAGLLTPGRSGFAPVGGADPGRVFATAPTPNGVVHVEPFTHHLRSVRGGGVYTMTLDAVQDIDVLAAGPADASNDRHDLIIAQQSDAAFGDPDSRLRIRHVVGIAANTPQDPPVTGSPDFISLARVIVRANATAITPGDLQGLRPADRATVALGGLLPIPDQAARTAISAPYAGMGVYRRDRRWVEVFDGTAWRVVGVAVAASTADRDTAITHPFLGQLAITTDPAGSGWLFTALGWTPFPDPPRAFLRQTGLQTLPNAVYVPIAFQTEDHDSHGGHINGPTNSRYTAPKAGIYLLSGGVAFAGNATGARACRWSKNGVRVPAGSAITLSTGVGHPNRMPAHTIQLRLAVGDFVQLEAFQDSGGTLDTVIFEDSASFLSILYIGT